MVVNAPNIGKEGVQPVLYYSHMSGIRVQALGAEGRDMWLPGTPLTLRG